MRGHYNHKPYYSKVLDEADQVFSQRHGASGFWQQMIDSLEALKGLFDVRCQRHNCCVTRVQRPFS